MAHIIKNALVQLESIKDYQKEILKSKGVEVEDNKSQLYYTEKIRELPDLEFEDKYVPEPLFVQFENEFNNDPLREENGGEYKYCSYVMLYAHYDSTYIYQLPAGCRLITSDGQDILQPASGYITNYSLQWDTSKDTLKLENGSIVRWFKFYTKGEYGNKETNFPCYAGDKSGQPTLVMEIYDSSKWVPVSQNKGERYITYSPIEYLILGKNVTTMDYYYNLYELYNLKKVKHLGEYIDTVSSTSGINICLESPSLKELDLNIRNIGSDLNLTVSQKVKFDFSKSTINSLGGFSNVYLDKVVFPETIISYTGITNMYAPKSDYIWTVPKVINENITIKFPSICCFFNFPNDWNNSLELGSDVYRAIINRENILQLFSRLKDNKNSSEQKTIKLNSRYRIVLSDSDLMVATNKNWTVTFA